MNIYRVYVQGMPHQDIEGDTYEVEGGVLEIFVEREETKEAKTTIVYKTPVASFREWNFIKKTNTEPLLTASEWEAMKPDKINLDKYKW